MILCKEKRPHTTISNDPRFCNQWVAGSTPVTSSKKDPAIYRQNGGVYRGVFAFMCVANPSECALFVPYCSKNALSECLTECLVPDARRGGFVPVYRLFDSKKACPVCNRAGSCAIWGSVPFQDVQCIQCLCCVKQFSL